MTEHGPGRKDTATDHGHETKATHDPDRVPVFGTWPRIYAAVIVNALIVMGLLALFSRWRY